MDVRRGGFSGNAAAEREEVRTGMMNAGGETAYLGAEAFEAFLSEDQVRWRAFVQATRKK